MSIFTTFCTEPVGGGFSLTLLCGPAFIPARSHRKWRYFHFFRFFSLLDPIRHHFSPHKNAVFGDFWQKWPFSNGGPIVTFPVDPDELLVSSENSSPRSVQKRQNRDKMGGTTNFCRHGQNVIFWSLGGHFLGKNIVQKLFSSFLAARARRAALKSL